jgi:hypothetical protein
LGAARIRALTSKWPDLVAVANRLTADDDLRGDLIYALSVMRTSTYIADDVILPGARTLQARIAEELEAAGARVDAP